MKQKEATIIKANGSSVNATPANGKHFHYKELQQIVGGYFELISDEDTMLVFDDEGKRKGKRLNVRATYIARGLGLITATDYIVGDVLVCPPEMVP